MLVIDIDLLARNGSGQARKPFLVTEAIISLALLNQLFRIFQIDTALLPLALHIGAHAAILVRSLIVHKPRLFQGPVNDIHGALHKTLLIGILNTQDKIPALMFGDQICIQSRPQIPHMHPPGGARRKSCSYFHFFYTPLFISYIFLF